MSCRSCNISDYNDWRINYRRDFSNVLFNQTYKLFDNIFRKIDLSNNCNLFSVKRTNRVVTNKEFFTRFDIDEDKIINGPENFDEFLKRRSPTPIDGSMYFLFGKKGTGKTSLIKYYIAKYLEKQKTVPIYVDLHGLNCHFNEITVYLKNKISSSLYNDDTYGKFFKIPDEAKKIREEYKELSNSLIIERILNDSNNYFQFLDQLLIYISKTLSRQIYLFIDNTDELSAEYVSEIVKCSYGIRSTIPIRVIHCLRDYWGGKGLICGRQYQVLSTYLTPPDIQDIIRMRLQHIKIPKTMISFNVDYYYYDDFGRRKDDNKMVTYEDAVNFLDAMIPYLLGDEDLVEVLYEMSNFDVRDVLDNIYNFFHSCNLPLLPVFQKTLLGKINDRKLNINDLVRNMMTIHSLCYDFDSSKVINLFNFKQGCGESSFRNTIGLIRILQRVSIKEMCALNDITDDFIKIGYLSKHLVNGINFLLNEGMIESPDGVDYKNVISLSITSKGSIYIRDIIHNFEYLSYVQDRVSMPSEYQSSIEDRFGNKSSLAGSGSFDKRSQAVLKFVSFLENEETVESNGYETDELHSVLMRIRGNSGKTFSSLRDNILKDIDVINRNIDYFRKNHGVTISSIKPVYINNENDEKHSHSIN